MTLPLNRGVTYKIALRYRRGSRFNQGAADTDPLNWPLISQGETTPGAAAPSPGTAVWSRTASDAEQITVTVTPAPGLEDFPIELYRAEVGNSYPSTPLETKYGPFAGDVEFVDDTITGETNYKYRVVTKMTNPSDPSDDIICWAGPAGTPAYVSDTPLGAGYRVVCENELSGAAVELWDTYDDAGGQTTSSLRATGSADADLVDSGTLTSVPSPGLTFLAKLRYKLTQFATDDYGQFGLDFQVTVPESE